MTLSRMSFFLGYAAVGMLLGLSLLGQGLTASEGRESFAAIMSGDDATAKRAAVQVLSSGGSDEDVIPLLVQAVGDRQTKDAAIAALRSRTGLKPPVKRGQSAYPGYPSYDTAASWSTWLEERKRVKAQEAKVKEVVKLAKDSKHAADATLQNLSHDNAEKPLDAENIDHHPGYGVADANRDSSRTDIQSIAPHLGLPARITFTNGTRLACYILQRNSDPVGRLVSVKIAHLDGRGEETVDASMIARINQDTQ